MKYRKLGQSGPEVSALGLGCTNFGGRMDDATCGRVIGRALDVGVTLFCTSDSYGERGGAEACLGEFLGTRRKDAVIATKFGNTVKMQGAERSGTEKRPGNSRRYLMSAVEASLQRLKTDWIDVYQPHYPDPETPIEETLRTLDDLVRQGKVRYIGCSNFTPAQIAEAQSVARAGGLPTFVTTEDEYNLVARAAERELLPTLAREGMGLLPARPLARGLLTGKYARGTREPAGGAVNRIAAFLSDRNWRIVEQLDRFAIERGHSLLELALGWLLAHPQLGSVIASSMTPEQMEANAAALGWEPTPAELAEIDRITMAPA